MLAADLQGGLPDWVQTGIGVTVLLWVVINFATDRWVTAKAANRVQAERDAAHTVIIAEKDARLAVLEAEVEAWRETAVTSSDAARVAAQSTEKALDNGKTTLGILSTLDRVLENREKG